MLNKEAYKGTKDLYPEDFRLQEYIFNTWKDIAKSYGYSQYDGPLIESSALYKAKSSDELVDEQGFVFTDKGNREIILRPEMTPTVSRMVAARRMELGYPLRLFSIPNCFRYERPQTGRRREFWQLNVDIFGEDSEMAEIEIIQIADAIMKRFGAKINSYNILISSREVLDDFYSSLSIDLDSRKKLTKLIDKYDKIQISEFEIQVQEIIANSIGKSGNKDEKFKEFMKYVQAKSISAIPVALHELESMKKLKRVLTTLEELGVSNAVFDPKITRGLDYYTGIVFEMKDNNPKNNRAMFGGGKYAGLVGMFGVENLPAVGFGMGDATIEEFLRGWDLLPDVRLSEIDLMISPMGEIAKSKLLIIAKNLRASGLKVALDYTDRKISNKIKAAEKLGIQSFGVLGENELASKLLSVKNLSNGEEKSIKIVY